jgi:hypothetical protein
VISIPGGDGRVFMYSYSAFQAIGKYINRKVNSTHESVKEVISIYKVKGLPLSLANNFSLDAIIYNIVI